MTIPPKSPAPETVNGRAMEENLAAQLHRDARTASRSRHVALIALALVGVAIYIGWRMKNSEPVVVPGNAAAVNFAVETSAPTVAPIAAPTPASLALPTDPPSSTAKTFEDFDEAILPSSPSDNWLAELPQPEKPALTTRSLETPILDAATEVLPTLPPAASLPPAPERSFSSSAPIPAPLAPPAPTLLPDRMLPSNSSGSSQTHIIKDGDSLPSLARAYYGESSTENIVRIRNANPHLPQSGFRVGVVLTIPLADSEVNTGAVTSALPPTPAAPSLAPTAASDENNPASAAGKTYTVVSGDTLSRIAAKVYGNPARWRDIYSLNKKQLERPDQLKIGMRLQLP